MNQDEGSSRALISMISLPWRDLADSRCMKGSSGCQNINIKLNKNRILMNIHTIR